MILFEDDLSVSLTIGQVSFKSYLPNKKLYLSRTTGRDFLVPCLGVTGRLDTSSFRYKFNSFEVSIVSCTWLKERRIFTQTKCFLVQLQTSLEVIEIFVQFHCLSSYRNDFVSSLLELPSLNILVLPCGTKFLRVLIFAIFPAIRKISSRK